ncbi:MAG: GNAT family N-acetyltransferase [Nocardioides sp.]
MDVDAELRIVPADQSSCEDLDVVYGGKASGYRCRCQRYKLFPGESFAGLGPDALAARQREQTRCGAADSGTTSGLVAYLDDEPVGWCAVEPRPAYHGLLRPTFRIHWEGREEDKEDESVWAITCVFARAGYRKQGVATALAAAAVEHARTNGARAVEAYPIIDKAALSEELHVGTEAMFADAGMTVVSHPSKRRIVMRLDF